MSFLLCENMLYASVLLVGQLFIPTNLSLKLLFLFCVCVCFNNYINFSYAFKLPPLQQHHLQTYKALQNDNTEQCYFRYPDTHTDTVT